DGVGGRVARRGVGRVIVIEADVEAGIVTLVLFADPRDKRLGGDPFGLGPQHDRRAMRVVGADVDTILALELLKAYPDVGLHHLHDMTEVDGTVGVWQRAGDEDATLSLAAWHCGAPFFIRRSRSCENLSDFYHLEVFLAHATIGAAPVVGDIFPAGTGRNAFIGQPQFLVIDELTHHAFPFLHVKSPA